MIWRVAVPALAGRRPWPSRRIAPAGLAVGAAAADTPPCGCCWCTAGCRRSDGWIAPMPAALLFLSITSVLFLPPPLYAVGYLPPKAGGSLFPRLDDNEELPFRELPRPSCRLLLLFLATMTLVTVSRHLGLMWVGVEATTLAAPVDLLSSSSPFARSDVEYLLICSVGIALALLGNSSSPLPRGLPAGR